LPGQSFPCFLEEDLSSIELVFWVVQLSFEEVEEELQLEVHAFEVDLNKLVDYFVLPLVDLGSS
jgi:hypothetical protein